MLNPFKYGKVVDKEDFCNRERELQNLKNSIINSQSVWLYSPRRYGKTSLLLKVFNEIDSIKVVYFDLYNILTITDFAQQFSKTISRDLFDWKEDIRNLAKKIGQYFSGFSPVVSLDENGNPSFSLGKQNIETKVDIEKILSIPEKVGQQNNIKICIAFDEFQEYKRINPFLVNQMRSIFQTQKMVSYIFSGSKQSLMNSLFSDIKSPFYEFGEKMIIEPITDADWFDFISNKFSQTGLSITRKTIQDILNISKGHPHFTQYFSSVVWNLINEGANQNKPEFLEQWLGRIINSQSDVFQNIMEQLTNNQRKVILALVENDALQLYAKKTGEKYKFPSDSSLNESVKGLVKKDIIEKHNGFYHIINPIMREWLKTIR